MRSLLGFVAVLTVFALQIPMKALGQSVSVIDNSENPQRFGYDVRSNHKTNNCEMYINGMGDGTETLYHAIGGNLYETWLRVNGAQQVERARNEILNVGGFFRYSEQTTEAPEPVVRETVVLGSRASDDPYLYRVDFRYKWHNTDRETSRTVHNFAFFVDIRRQDSLVYRLWLTNGERDFTVSEVFDRQPLTPWISVGPSLRSMRYIEGYANSPIFDARRICRF